MIAPVSQSTLTRPYQPATFLERGASAPFTSPILAGARVRASKRVGLELVVPNPSGGRGSYVLPWTDMAALGRPTVHDGQLTARIAALRNVTPCVIRRASRQVASEGLAGRAASGAAVAALAAERESLVVTNFELLLRLVQQEEPPGTGLPPPDTERPADLERRAKRVIASIATRLGREPTVIAANLEQLAALFDPIGLEERRGAARLPNAVETVRLMREDALRLPTITDEHAPALIDILVKTAEMTATTAEYALTNARLATRQMMTLLAAWQNDPLTVGGQLTRADWLLDGWDRVCQLWAHDPRPAARLGSLEEIASLLPVIPREVGDWAGFPIDVPPFRLRQLVHGHQDWRTGLCVQDSIARNELLLAA